MAASRDLVARHTALLRSGRSSGPPRRPWGALYLARKSGCAGSSARNYLPTCEAVGGRELADPDFRSARVWCNATPPSSTLVARQGRSEEHETSSLIERSQEHALWGPVGQEEAPPVPGWALVQVGHEDRHLVVLGEGLCQACDEDGRGYVRPRGGKHHEIHLIAWARILARRLGEGEVLADQQACKEP